MDLQDGKWIGEDEEASVNRGTSKPGAWCFVLSSFWPCLDSNLCHCIKLSDELLPPLSLPLHWGQTAMVSQCMNVSVSLSFLSNLLWLDNKFWLSWGFVCCFVGWGSRNPLRTWMRACCSLLKFHIYQKVSTVGSLWYDLASMIEYAFAWGVDFSWQTGHACNVCRSNDPRAGHSMFHSGVAHSIQAQAEATYSSLRKGLVLDFGQAFMGVGALNGKLENLQKIGGKLADQVLATKGAFSTC